MDYTPRLHLPYIAAQQAQKQVTYNAAMRRLDLLVQLSVLSWTLTAPPGSPDEGDAHIVGAGATGLWAGQDGRIAQWRDGGWLFVEPQEGWIAFVPADGAIVVFSGGGWTLWSGPAGAATFGVNATADLTSRLAVGADASLFTHDGAGHRLTINKAAAGDTAAQLFQTGYSGRAEFGLAGDDDFHFKVSPDGSTWHEALVADRTSGRLTLAAGRLTFPTTQQPSADAHTLDDYEEGTFTPGIAFGGAAVGVTYDAGNHGRYTKIGRMVFAAGRLALTARGSSTGAATLTGLPFASVNVAGHAQPGCVGASGGVSGVTGAILVAAEPNATIAAIAHTNGGASAALTHAAFTDTALLSFSLAYEAAA